MCQVVHSQNRSSLLRCLEKRVGGVSGRNGITSDAGTSCGGRDLFGARRRRLKRRRRDTSHSQNCVLRRRLEPRNYAVAILASFEP